LNCYIVGILLRVQIKTLHEESVVVDTHCDTLKCLIPMFTLPHNSQWDDRSDIGMGVRSELGHIDFPRLKEGGVNCQVFAISSVRDKTRAYALRTAMEMISIFYSECEKYKNTVTPISSYSEIIEASAKGMIAAMLSIEGADVIEGKIGLLKVFHQLGVRMVGLVHSIRNELADGVADQRTGGGLSDLGVQAVEELDRLGILIDVSHLSDAGFWDLLDIAKGPVMASHSNARAVCDHPRNMTDDMIKAMAERKGVMGMNFAPHFVHPTQATVNGVVDHIDHIVNLVGSDFVGLGSDFDGIPFTPTGLEDVTMMPNITAELVNRNYSEEDIKKILGENHLRLIKEVVG
jgi:membrane dipeptidase